MPYIKCDRYKLSGNYNITIENQFYIFTNRHHIIYVHISGEGLSEIKENLPPIY